MKFNCKEISISDDALGCTLTLSEKKEIDTGSKKMTMDDLMLENPFKETPLRRLNMITPADSN